MLSRVESIATYSGENLTSDLAANVAVEKPTAAIVALWKVSRLRADS